MKRKTNILPFAAKLGKIAPQPAISLGALQSEFLASGKALKSAATKLANARDTFEAAKAKHSAASNRLAEASRTVLTGE